MAFFKFRKVSADTVAATASAPESAESMRRRARYRLVGASLLVLAGVIVFPLLFDNQPRPVAVDLPIEIPDKDASQAPDQVAKPAAREASGVVAGSIVAAPASAPAQAAVESVTGKATEVPEVLEPSKPADTVDQKAVPKAEHDAAPRSASQAADAAKAKALLEGKVPEKATAAATGARYVVQFGAFTDSAKAQETRMKVERAGLKTYAQTVQTAEGKKYRVRVGPFQNKSDAEKAAEKIKKLNLPAAILEL